jgi:hypothetical protein
MLGLLPPVSYGWADEVDYAVLLDFDDVVLRIDWGIFWGRLLGLAVTSGWTLPREWIVNDASFSVWSPVLGESVTGIDVAWSDEGVPFADALYGVRFNFPSGSRIVVTARLEDEKVEYSPNDLLAAMDCPAIDQFIESIDSAWEPFQSSWLMK